MLEIKNLNKIYSNGKSKVKALDNVSLNFGAKGLVAILGKSGCGKSTLINMIGGLDLPTSGEIIINGRSSSTFSKTELDSYRNTYVGVVFQEFNLIDEISVFQNIDMTMKLQEKNADINTVDEVLSMVGLSNLGYRKPSELSGGQRQRVALARALLKKPEIILADEPTGSLDSTTGEEVFESLKKISQDKLVIVVTHDRDLAYTYGERIIEILDGRIISDIIRQESNLNDIKELSDEVIEISSPAKLNAEIINKRLAADKVNYIGLSYDKERIALAYSDTVDCFYERADAHRYAKTEAKDLKTDDKPFKLSKGKMPLKDALKMARANIKRSRRRYVLLSVLTSFCFTFLIIAIIAGSINISDLVAKSTFDSHGQKVVAISKTQTSAWGETRKSPITEGDIDYVLDVFNTKNYARYADLTMTPLYAVGNYKGYGSFAFSSFTGILEGNPSTLGFSLVAGSKKECEGAYEIIISDMAAFEILRSGYAGFDNSGKSGVFFPEKFTDLIGAKIKFTETNKYYTIAGIFQTDYEDYKSTMTASRIDSNAEKLLNTFLQNNLFLYSKMFVSDEFYAVCSAEQGVNNRYIDVFYSNYWIGFGDSLNDLSYSKAELLAANKDAKLMWSNNSDLTLPNALASKEVILDFDDVRNVLGLYNATEEELLADSSFKQFVEQPLKITLSYYSEYINNRVESTQSYTIVGVYKNINSNNWRKKTLFNDDDIKIFAGNSDYTTIYVGRTNNRYNLQSKLDKLQKHGYYAGSAGLSSETLIEVDSAVKQIAKVFLYIALGFAAFAFLIIYNYMSSSVRFRRKEIAVYRVIGAKPRDVAKIFLSEGGIITVQTTAIVSVLAWLICLLLNSMLSGIVSLFGLTVTLINFTLFHPFIILGLVAAFFIVSSIIPISRITRKTPIEALKLL